MAGWDKGGHGISQHDDPGSYMDSARPSNLEKDHKGAAVACLSSITKAISQVSVLMCVVSPAGPETHFSDSNALVSSRSQQSVVRTQSCLRLKAKPLHLDSVSDNISFKSGEFVIFSVRQLIYIARYMLSPVRLSATWVDQSKMLQVRIMQLSPLSSPMTLVSSRLTSPRYCKGNIGSRDAE